MMAVANQKLFVLMRDKGLVSVGFDEIGFEWDNEMEKVNMERV